MAFTKFVNFTSTFVQTIFNDAHGAMWAINGRLSGFYPFPVSGDPGTLGITSVVVPAGVQRTITVNLNAPGVADDLRFAPAGNPDVVALNAQLTSFCLADGVLLKADTDPVTSGIVLSLNLIDTTDPLTPISSPDRIMIYAEYDDSDSPPTFAVARESAIDTNPIGEPIKKAKLAFYDPISQTWQPTPQISVGGIFQTSVDVNSKYGGLLASRLDSGTLKVTPGTVIGSFGRITSSGIRLVPSLSFPAAGLFRKDMLVITDPQSETNELVQPLFAVLRGREAANVGVTEPPPAPLDPKQVPLAEIMMSSSGIGQVIDIRPIMAWQTDSMMQSAPVAFEKIDIDTIQPGFIATDITQATPVGWGLIVFRGLTSAGGVKNSSMAIGLVNPAPNQPPFSKSFTTTTPAFNPYTPTSTPVATADFPARPWILEDSFRVVKTGGSLADVTHDPLYNINFDFKTGIFAPPGITPQVSPEGFAVSFRQLKAIFVIDDDGTIHVPELDAFFRHIAIDNPSAHKAYNIVYNNAAPGVTSLPGHPSTTEPSVNVQTAIESLANDLQQPSTLSAVYLESWRCVGGVAFNLPPAVPLPNVAGPQAINFIGPSGYSSSYATYPVPVGAPDDLIDDGSNFFPLSGDIIGVTASLVASYPNTGAFLDSLWKFSIWIDDVEVTPLDEARFSLITTESFTVAARTQRSLHHSGAGDPRNVFTLTPHAVQRGQIIRLALFTPTMSGVIPASFSADINLSLDFIIKLT